MSNYITLIFYFKVHVDSSNRLRQIGINIKFNVNIDRLELKCKVYSFTLCDYYTFHKKAFIKEVNCSFVLLLPVLPLFLD